MKGGSKSDFGRSTRCAGASRGAPGAIRAAGAFAPFASAWSARSPRTEPRWSEPVRASDRRPPPRPRFPPPFSSLPRAFLRRSHRRHSQSHSRLRLRLHRRRLRRLRHPPTHQRVAFASSPPLRPPPPLLAAPSARSPHRTRPPYPPLAAAGTATGGTSPAPSPAGSRTAPSTASSASRSGTVSCRTRPRRARAPRWTAATSPAA